MKIKPTLTVPKRTVHSLAATGRSEEGRAGVDAALPQNGTHCSSSWEVGRTEDPETVWQWETAKSSQRSPFQFRAETC